MYFLFSGFVLCVLRRGRLQSLFVGSWRTSSSQQKLTACSLCNFQYLLVWVSQCVSSSHQHGNAPNNNSDNSMNIIKNLMLFFYLSCLLLLLSENMLAFSIKTTSSQMIDIIKHHRCDLCLLDIRRLMVLLWHYDVSWPVKTSTIKSNIRLWGTNDSTFDFKGWVDL